MERERGRERAGFHWHAIISVMRRKNANVFVHVPASFCGVLWRLWWMIDATLVVADRMVTCGSGSKQGTELGQICHTPTEKQIP